MSTKQLQQRSRNRSNRGWQISRESEPVARTSPEELEKLKEELLNPLLWEASDSRLQARYRWAAQDAAALAFVTPWPQLFLPSLLAEKAQAAREQFERQEAIRRRCAGDESEVAKSI